MTCIEMQQLKACIKSFAPQVLSKVPARAQQDLDYIIAAISPKVDVFLNAAAKRARTEERMNSKHLIEEAFRRGRLSTQKRPLTSDEIEQTKGIGIISQ